MSVEDYRADTVQVDDHWTGVAELTVDREQLDVLHRDGKLELEAGDHVLAQHECLVLRSGPSTSGLARVVDVRQDSVVAQRVNGTPRAFGVHPRDVRQTFALDLLTDPAVPCVSLMGMAGTGKTFLALAAGLEQVLEARAYRRLSVYRPLVAVGRQEIGYLPGDLDEKLQPWMAAVHDNLYSLFRRDDDTHHGHHALAQRDLERTVDSLVDRGQLEMAAITYLRGRSITDEFVIVDEAQNLELPTLKVILTRMAAGSKVVFCGDLTQVDNPYISPFGGMAALIEKLKGSALFGHVAADQGRALTAGRAGRERLLAPLVLPAQRDQAVAGEEVRDLAGHLDGVVADALVVARDQGEADGLLDALLAAVELRQQDLLQQVGLVVGVLELVGGETVVGAPRGDRRGEHLVGDLALLADHLADGLRQRRRVDPGQRLGDVADEVAGALHVLHAAQDRDDPAKVARHRRLARQEQVARLLELQARAVHLDVGGSPASRLVRVGLQPRGGDRHDRGAHAVRCGDESAVDLRQLLAELAPASVLLAGLQGQTGERVALRVAHRSPIMPGP